MAALAQAMPAVSAAGAIVRLTIVQHLRAAFVTLSDPAHADALLSLNNCVLPLVGAPVIEVCQTVARARKGKRPHAEPGTVQAKGWRGGV